MSNLLSDTKLAMFHRYTPEDIITIGLQNGKSCCDWETFTKIADRTYDSGYGLNEVELGLTIYFKDGTRLVRREYDGAEWWELIELMPDFTNASQLTQDDIFTDF